MRECGYVQGGFETEQAKTVPYYDPKASDGDLIPEAGEKVTLSVAKRTEGITSDMTCSVISLDTTTATVNKRNATSTTAFINISNKYKTGNPIPLKIVLTRQAWHKTVS